MKKKELFYNPKKLSAPPLRGPCREARLEFRFMTIKNIFNIRGTKIYASVNSSCAQPSPLPPPPPSYCGAFARLVSRGGGPFANFALPGGRAFANPGANSELLTRTRFPIRISLHKRFYRKNKQIGSFVNDGKN